MPEGPPEKKQRLEDPGRPVVQANSCIQFHFLNTQGKDTPYHSQLSFPPEFTHQLFGDDEEIKGFEGLQIRVNLAQPSFRAYVDVACTLHRPDADDVDGQFRKHFPDVSFSKADFTQKLARDAAQLTTAQLGEPIRHSQGTTVHHFNLSKAAQILKDVHARMQPLLLFFVDAASEIDQEDEDWDLFLAVQQQAGHPQIVGFCTVYNYYAWPDRKRLRLSQILIWPPFQRQGLGCLLLQSVYALADRIDCADVTFEDPTEELQSLREKVDVERALATDWLPLLAAKTAAAGISSIKAKAAHANGAANGAANGHANGSAELASSSKHAGGESQASGDKENMPHIPLAFNLAMSADSEARARQQLRLTKEQMRKVWETLLIRQEGMLHEAQGVDMLRVLIGHRLACNRENTKMTEGKRVVNGEGESFVMMRFSAEFAAKFPKSTEPEGHDGSTGAAAKESDIREMIDDRIEALIASLD